MIAQDALTESAELAAGNPETFQHTPIGTPRGVVVAVTRTGAGTDYVTGVTYGGVAMTRVQFATEGAGEPGSAYLYFLGSNVPTGQQTISIATDGNTAAKRGVCITFTAAFDTAILASDKREGDQADPQISLTAAEAAFRYAFIFSGHNLASSLVETAGSTRIHAQSFASGTKVSVGLKEDAASIGPTTVGWTATIEDVAMVAAAIGEILDQSATYQAMIDSAPDGTEANPTVIDLPAGTYRIDQGLKMDTRSHLRLTCTTGVFTAKTLKTSDDLSLSSRIHFFIRNSVNCVGSNLRVEGPNSGRDVSNPDFALYTESLEDDHAFSMRTGCQKCGFEDCTFTEVNGDGVNLGFANNGVANRNCFARRITGTYAGRQGLALTHVDGFEGTDISTDWGGRSGLDIEPNSSFDKVWNVHLNRCSFGSQFFPFNIQGASNGALPQRHNITLTNCSAIRCPSNHTAIQANRSPSIHLVIDGHTDTRQPSIYGMVIDGWDRVLVEDCTITTSNNTPTSYAVRANVSDVLIIRNNTFNGKPATEGFDQLYEFISTPPTIFEHYGNTWAMGTQTDGTRKTSSAPGVQGKATLVIG